MIVITLQEYGGYIVGPLGEEEIKLFSTMEKAESWLMDNGFVYGKRTFFKYGDSFAGEWFHQHEEGIAGTPFVNITIREVDVDDDEESIYRFFRIYLDEKRRE